MLNSTEHEILNAQKYKISRNSAFSGSDKPIMLFFLLINVEMPTVVNILTFMNRKNFMLSSAENDFFTTSGLVLESINSSYRRFKSSRFNSTDKHGLRKFF